jgi:hypothetical protein
MWIVTRDSDGAIVAGPAEEPPVAGSGETLRRVPLETIWNPARQAFEDTALWVERRVFFALWPPAAAFAANTSLDPEMVLARTALALWDGPINLRDPRVLAGINRAETLGILTSAEADRMREGLPPS